MGKSRRNRSSAARRTDPVVGGRRPRPVKAPSDPQLAALRDEKILPVVRDLRSADPQVRTAAAGAIANIVEDARCRKLLLREQIVHVVLSETLADSGIESRAAGWEILNVLAQLEEADFGVHLFRSDILTPAAHALGQIVETLQQQQAPAAKLTKAQQDFVWRLTLSLVDLLGRLAESRDEILVAMAGHADITRGLFGLVCCAAAGSSSSPGKVAQKGLCLPFDVRWGAVMVLARLCEDQRALAQAVVDDQTSGGCYAALRQLTQSGGAMAVAASAALHAVFATLEWFDHSPGRDGASDAALVPVLVGAIAGLLRQDSKAEGADGASGEGQSAEVLEQALQVLAMMGTSLKAGLEKGNRDAAAMRAARNGAGAAAAEANGGDEDLALEQEDSEMFEDDDAEPSSKANGKLQGSRRQNTANEDDEMDEDDDMDMDADMERVTGADDPEGEEAEAAAALDDMPTLRELLTTAVPQIIRVVRAESLLEETLGSGGSGKDKAGERDAAALAVRLGGLAALSNLAWTLSCVDATDDGNAGILRAWGRVARQIWLEVVRPLVVVVDSTVLALSADTNTASHTAIVASVASLAWALARVLGGETPVDAGEPARFAGLRDALQSAEATSAAASTADDGKEDPFQAPAVMCIGVLGQLARDPAPADVNRTVGEYFLAMVDALPDSAASVSTVAEVVEALNQFFDLYGDESAACDKEVFWPGHFVERLEAGAAKVKAAAKSVDKRTHTELRTRADEVVLNLGRFIQYKKKRAPRQK